MTSTSSFIDQNLATQLFVAARSHDSLRTQFDDFLPPAISDIFPSKATKSNKVCHSQILFLLFKSLSTYNICLVSDCNL
jgi:hypothetical protein